MGVRFRNNPLVEIFLCFPRDPYHSRPICASTPDPNRDELVCTTAMGCPEGDGLNKMSEVAVVVNGLAAAPAPTPAPGFQFR
jgi:hypothetical protein